MSNPIKKLGKAIGGLVSGIGKIIKKLGPVIIMAAVVVAAVYTAGAATAAMGPAGAVGTAPVGVAYGGAVPSATGVTGAAGATGASTGAGFGTFTTVDAAAGAAATSVPAANAAPTVAGLNTTGQGITAARIGGSAANAAPTSVTEGMLGVSPGTGRWGINPVEPGISVGPHNMPGWSSPEAMAVAEDASATALSANTPSEAGISIAKNANMKARVTSSSWGSNLPPNTPVLKNNMGVEIAKDPSLWTKTKDFVNENPLLAYGGMQMAGNVIQALGEEDEEPNIHPGWGDSNRVHRAYANAKGATMGVAEKPTPTLLDPKKMKQEQADFSDPTSTFRSPVATQTFTSGAAQAVPEGPRRRSLLDGGQNA